MWVENFQKSDLPEPFVNIFLEIVLVAGGYLLYKKYGPVLVVSFRGSKKHGSQVFLRAHGEIFDGTF